MVDKDGKADRDRRQIRRAAGVDGDGKDGEDEDEGEDDLDQHSSEVAA